MSQTPRTRITRSHTLHILAPRHEVFPLLCAAREHDWIEGWNGTFIYSESGFMEDGCIFEADIPGFGHVLWNVTQYDTENCTSRSVRVNPEISSSTIQFTLTDSEDGGTHWRWDETMTALTDAGDELLAGFSEEVFAMQMGHLEAMLNHYCRTGEKLTSSMFAH